MAKRDGKDLDAVDMGSVEGFVTADSIVSSAAKHGTLGYAQELSLMH